MGLRLTVLGSSAAWSYQRGHPSSSYLVEIGDDALILDLGQGALGSLFPHRDPATVAAVAVTHMHGDHHVDLIPLRNLLYYHYEEPRSVSLHLPPGLRQRYDAFMGEAGFLDFLPGPDVEAGVRRIGPFELEAQPVTHSEHSHAFRVSDLDAPAAPGLVYSGDCGRADDLLPLIREGDTLLCEAFWSTREPVPSANHLTAGQAADVAVRSRAGHLILTHILEAYDPAAALVAARERFAGPVDLAAPDMVLEIGAAR